MATRLTRGDNEGLSGAEEEISLALDGVVFEDGLVFQNGEQVQFTAGTDPEVKKKYHEQQLFERLSNLHLFRDELWNSSARGGLDSEEPNDDRYSFDCDAQSAFESLGAFSCFPVIYRSDSTLDVPENGGDIELEDALRNSDWEPYGSKTVGYTSNERKNQG